MRFLCCIMRKTQCDIGGGNKITNKEMEHIKATSQGSQIPITNMLLSNYSFVYSLCSFMSFISQSFIWRLRLLSLLTIIYVSIIHPFVHSWGLSWCFSGQPIPILKPKETLAHDHRYELGYGFSKLGVWNISLVKTEFSSILILGVESCFKLKKNILAWKCQFFIPLTHALQVLKGTKSLPPSTIYTIYPWQFPIHSLPFPTEYPPSPSANLPILMFLSLLYFWNYQSTCLSIHLLTFWSSVQKFPMFQS